MSSLTKVQTAADPSYDSKEEGELSDGGSLSQEESQKVEVKSEKVPKQAIQQPLPSQQFKQVEEIKTSNSNLLKKRQYREDQNSSSKQHKEEDSDAGAISDQGELGAIKVQSTKRSDKEKSKRKSPKKDNKQDYDSAEEIIKKLKTQQAQIGKYQINEVEGKSGKKYKVTHQTYSSYDSDGSRDYSPPTTGFKNQSINKQQKQGKSLNLKGQGQGQMNQNKQNKFGKSLGMQNKHQNQKGQVYQNKQKDQFFTTKQGKKFNVKGNQGTNSQQKQQKSVYLSQSLCKYVLTNTCHRGADCNFSHATIEFPCKYLHGTGFCEKGQQCKFGHRLLNPEEIHKFMGENEEFLTELKQKTGKTNLGDYFDRFVMQKENQQNQRKTEHAMLPPQLINQSQNQQSMQGSYQPNQAKQPQTQNKNQFGNQQQANNFQQNNNPQQQAIQQLQNALKVPDILKLLQPVQQPQQVQQPQNPIVSALQQALGQQTAGCQGSQNVVANLLGSILGSTQQQQIQPSQPQNPLLNLLMQQMQPQQQQQQTQVQGLAQLLNLNQQQFQDPRMIASQNPNDQLAQLTQLLQISGGNQQFANQQQNPQNQIAQLLQGLTGAQPQQQNILPNQNFQNQLNPLLQQLQQQNPSFLNQQQLQQQPQQFNMNQLLQGMNQMNQLPQQQQQAQQLQLLMSQTMNPQAQNLMNLMQNPVPQLNQQLPPQFQGMPGATTDQFGSQNLSASNHNSAQQQLPGDISYTKSQQKIQRQESQTSSASGQVENPYDPRKKDSTKKSQLALDIENLYKKLQKGKSETPSGSASGIVQPQSISQSQKASQQDSQSSGKQSSTKGDEISSSALNEVNPSQVRSSSNEQETNAQTPLSSSDGQQNLDKNQSNNGGDQDFFSQGKKVQTEQAKQSLKDRLALSGIIRKNA